MSDCDKRKDFSGLDFLSGGEGVLPPQFETLDPRTTSEWSCSFENYLGNSEELSGIIKQMSIYESIYNNCMFGNIKVQDGTGLVEANGIIGSGKEKIHFEMLTENTVGFNSVNLEKIFTIGSISTGLQSPKFTEYDIGIVSPYLIKNNKTKISRSFKMGETASDIANYIGAKVLEFEDGAPHWARFDVSPTLHEKAIVVPNWNPFQVLNFLAKNSVSKNGESNYLFFENNDSFKFMSVDELLAKEPTRKLALKNMPDKIKINNDITVDNAMMTNYSENARFNISGGQNMGMYGSGILAHNILEKWMEKYEVIYDGPLDKIMAETIGLNGPEDKPFKDFNTWQHSGLMSHNYLYNIHHLGEKSHYPLHDMKKTNLRANIIKFDIPGDTNIFAGNVIQLMIPTHIHNHNLPEDQYLTGNWLVTAIHHKISNTGYVCTLECMKDGFFGDPDVVIPERAWETGGYNAYANEFDGI